MAKIIVPEIAIRNKETKKGKWHLRQPYFNWRDHSHTGYYSTTSCRQVIYEENREEEFIENLAPIDLCKSCMGGFVATPNDEKYIIIEIEEGHAGYADSSGFTKEKVDTLISSIEWDDEIDANPELSQYIGDFSEGKGAAYAKIKLCDPTISGSYDRYYDDFEVYVDYVRAIVLSEMMEYPEDEIK